MNASPKLRPLVLALCTIVSVAAVAPAFAQQQAESGSMRDQRAKRMKELGKEKDSKQAAKEEAMWPGATRVEPKDEAKGKNLKSLQDIQKLYTDEDYAGAMAKAEAFAAGSGLNAYEQSFAYQLAGASASALQDEAKSAEYFKKAIDANGLDNNNHYTAMYNLVATYYTAGKNEEALALLDKFLAETKSEKPEYQQLRAQLLANTGRGGEAAKTFEDQLAKNPNDKKALLNAVSAYQASGDDAKATKLLEEGYNKGMLTEAKQLQVLYSNYLNAERFKDAQKVIEDGAAKGILKEGPDLATAYSLLGQNAYYNGSDADALNFYGKAAPMAKDGEAYLNQAKILRAQGKTADAKAAAQKALDKGLKKPQEAKEILAD
ncbi:TPR domain containing protein [Lysobacter dokdonensis DS-58]|uniref:TPR domain containing protein n=1 Tax=Lysobacter dokdonensis DS-58 TaxID=1300345 RepID=A0A0A2X1X4_9GAMM|nr:tetratricopeptide repeat protein [Lysobacter dokdonensis]KGQ19174.1 TPR domain containing protein [Lysobacter dokdonensis DS-58]